MSLPVIRFAAAGAVEPEDLGRLSEHERGRYGRLRNAEARASYVAAHLLVRECLSELAGEGLEIVQRCATCGGVDHGAPYVVGHPDLHVSLSHSHDWVAAMAATAPCGIDVQVLAHVPDRALTEHELASSPDRVRRNRLWARKEALIKAGAATLDDLSRLDVLDPDPRLHDWDGEGVVGAWALLSSAPPAPRTS